MKPHNGNLQNDFVHWYTPIQIVYREMTSMPRLLPDSIVVMTYFKDENDKRCNVYYNFCMRNV